MLRPFQIERVVFDLQHAQFPDGFENRFQITQGRRYVFDENSVSDAFILQNHIAGRKTVEQPLGEIVLNQFGFVFDVVFVGGLVAGDTYVEELFDGFAVLVEGPQRNGLAFGQVVKQPPAVDFGKGDASGTIDRIGQPDISVEEIGCHRNQFAVKIQKNAATCGQSLCKDAILYPDFSALKYLLENGR